MDFDDIEESNLDFKEVDRKYSAFKHLHEQGIVTDKEFDEQLKRWMIQDEQDRWWSKSLKSGEWHYFDGTTWVKSIPPGLQPTPQETLPTEERLSDEQRQGMRREAQWGLKAVLGTLAVGLASAAWLVWALVQSFTVLIVQVSPTMREILSLNVLVALIGTLVGLGGSLIAQGGARTLVGLYRRQATIGLLLACIGGIGLSTTFVLQAVLLDPLLGRETSLPAVGALMLLFILFICLGLILTGVVHIRAGVPPRWRGWGSLALITLLIGSVLHPIFASRVGSNVVPTAIACAFGCIWGALAYVLWSQLNAAHQTSTSTTERNLSYGHPQVPRQEAWWRQKEILGSLVVVFPGAMWLVMPLVTVLFLGRMLWIWSPIGTLVGTLVALWGLRMQQAESYRRRATIGLMLASISFACLLIVYAVLPKGPPNAASIIIISILLLLLLILLLMCLGFILAGIAYVRARVLLPWEGIALIPLIVGTVVQPILSGSAQNRGNTAAMAAQLDSMATVAAMAFGFIWLVLAYRIFLRQRAVASPR